MAARGPKFVDKVWKAVYYKVFWCSEQLLLKRFDPRTPCMRNMDVMPNQKNQKHHPQCRTSCSIAETNFHYKMATRGPKMLDEVWKENCTGKM